MTLNLQDFNLSDLEDIYYLIALEDFFSDYKVNNYRKMLNVETPRDIFNYYCKKFSFLDDYLEISKINIEKMFKKNINIIKSDKITKINEKIHNLPIIIYFLGNINILSSKLAAVAGTRNPNSIGINVAKNVSNSLIEQGYKIVSGLAVGIDSVAHKESIKTGTIAVLAHGILDCYPKENKKLKEEIIDENGLVVSQFNVCESPKPKNFLERNKTIVNLSEFLFVPQAKEKSGSTFTAKYANKIGKTVYSANINSEDFSGNTYLIKNKIAEILDLQNFSL